MLELGENGAVRWLIAVCVVGLLLAVAGPGLASGGAAVSVRLVPEHPAAGSTATLEIRGSTQRTAIPLVLSVATPGCPARIPASGKPLVPSSGVVTGGISAIVRVRIDAATTRLCVFLVPASEDAYGNSSYVATAQPLAVAGIAVGGAPRLSGGGVLFGHTRSDNSSVGLTVSLSGTRVTKLTVTCGGNPLRPPALGKAFIGKRFVARVSLVFANRIRWAGRMLPDNSANYDPPIPARWNGAVQFTLDAKLVFLAGQPDKITGTGRLSGRGLPCPAARRYVRS